MKYLLLQALVTIAVVTLFGLLVSPDAFGGILGYSIALGIAVWLALALVQRVVGRK
jgi:hypothetical protein